MKDAASVVEAKIAVYVVSVLMVAAAAGLMVFFWWVDCSMRWDFYYKPRVEKMLAPAEADTIQAVRQPRLNCEIEVAP